MWSKIVDRTNMRAMSWKALSIQLDPWELFFCFFMIDLTIFRRFDKFITVMQTAIAKNSAQTLLILMLLFVVVRFSLGRVFYKLVN